MKYSQILKSKLIFSISLLLFIGLMFFTIMGLITRPRHRTSPRRSVRLQQTSLEAAIQSFDLECGFYPEHLHELIDGPLSKDCPKFPKGGILAKNSIPNDPWGSKFIYLQQGLHNKDGFYLWSRGPDLTSGTQDDITNWVQLNQAL